MSDIYKIVSSTDLFHDLKQMGRDNFSYDGAKALMEHLEEIAENTEGGIEYDPIAFCCDFAEYSEEEYKALADEYNEAPNRADYESDDEFNEAFLDWLRDETTVIEFDGGLIVEAF